MTTEQLLKAVNKLMSELEGQLQDALKRPTNANDIETMRRMLKYLYGKRTELQEQMQ